jgi:hypothetical protein
MDLPNQRQQGLGFYYLKAGFIRFIGTAALLGGFLAFGTPAPVQAMCTSIDMSPAGGNYDLSSPPTVSINLDCTNNPRADYTLSRPIPCTSLSGSWFGNSNAIQIESCGASGDYTLHITATDDDGGGSSRSENYRLTFTPQTVNLNFTITNGANGQPISGALVEIDRDFGNGNTRTTGGGGFANFGVDEQTSIGWTVSAPGYITNTGNVFTLPHPNHTNVNVNLTPLCGNGAIDSGEQCDGSNLNGESCSSLGFSGGTLSCSNSCTFNTSGCSSNPPPQPPVITSPGSASGTVGASFDYTITASNNPTRFAISPSLPPGLVININTGQISGTPTTEGTFNVTMRATNDAGSDSRPLTITISPEPSQAPVIDSPGSAAGTVGASFIYTITATNSPTSFSVNPLLPPGLALNANTGQITGTPTTEGTFTVTMRAANNFGEDSKPLTITISPAGVPVHNPVGSHDFSDCTETKGWACDENDYSAGLTIHFYADGPAGTGTFLGSATANQIRMGGLGGNCGVAAGVPTSHDFTFPTPASLKDGSQHTIYAYALNVPSGPNPILSFSPKTLTCAAPPTPAITNNPLTASGVVGTAFSYTLQASNSPTSFSATTPLPAGLSLNTANGQITGTPTAAGTTNVTVNATNGNGTGPNATLVITISAAPTPVITSALTASGVVGTAFSYTLEASNGPINSFGATALPAGLSLNAISGQITGTPTTAGTTNVTVNATNGNGTGPDATLVITITAAPQPPTITSALTASGVVGTPFSYQIAATNGPFTDFNASGLPAGLSLNETSGLISGTPTTASISNVTLNATNGAGQGPDATLVVTITAAPAPISVTGFTILAGTNLDNIFFGVPTQAPVRATFNVPINTASLTGRFSITQNGANVPATASYAESNGVPTVSILPSAGFWQPNTAYQVILAAGVTDTSGNATTESPSIFFMTAPAAGQSSSIVTPLDTVQAATVQSPSGALPAAGFIVPRTQFINPAAPLTANAAALNILNQGPLTVMARAEINIFPCTTALVPGCASGTSPASSPQPVTLTLRPQTLSPEALARVDRTTLGIYTLGSNGFVKLPNATVNADGSVSAPITQSALYFLAGALPTQLDSSHAYPVPYKPSAGHTVITFVNLAVDSTIKIYTITGERVKELRNTGEVPTVEWDVKNSDGESVASGVYIYQIKNPYSEKRGKLVIIR